MNRILLLIATAAVLSLLVNACKEGAKNPTPLSTGELTVQDTAAYQPLYIHPLLAQQELNSQHTALGGYGQVMPPPMETRLGQLLTKSFWVMEFYYDSHATVPQRRRGKGQWFQFNKDGTFLGGHWERQTHSGLWYLQPDGSGRDFIIIDSNIDRLDSKWEIQAINGEEDAMGWVRQTDFGPKTPKSVTVKMMELYNIPTKEQFGVTGEE